MLYDFLKTHLGQNVAPFAALVMFVVVVGLSLWLTPRLAKWIDSHRSKNRGYFDDMMEKPSENENQD